MKALVLLTILGFVIRTIEGAPYLDELLHRVRRQAQECYGDIAIVIDSSGSINHRYGSRGWTNVTEFAASLVRKLPSVGLDYNRVAVIVYSNDVKVVQYLNNTNSKEETARLITGLRYMESTTNTMKAIKVVNEEVFTEGRGDRPYFTNIMIAITDGVPNLNWEETNHVKEKMEETRRNAMSAKNRGIKILGVGIGFDKTEYEKRWGRSGVDTLKYILATDDNDLIKTSTSPSSLNRISELVIQQINSQCKPAPTQPTPDDKCKMADVVFLLDSSGSINKRQGWRDGWRRILEFANYVVGRLDVGRNRVRVGVVSFSNDVTMAINLTNNLPMDQLKQRILRIPHKDGLTNTPDALNIVNRYMFNANNGDRPQIINVLVSMTDGVPNLKDEDDRHVEEMYRETERRARELRDRGTKMVAIGIGLHDTTLGPKTLRVLTSQPQTLMFQANTSEDLNAIRDTIATRIVGECNNNGAVTVVTTPKSDPIPECREEGDLCLVLDNSGSVSPSRFSMVKEFAKNLVKELEVARDKWRIALVTFNSQATEEFNLNKYNDKNSVLAAIDAVAYKSGKTDMARAFEMVRNRIFTSGGGDRQGKRNLVVLMSDCNAMDEKKSIDEAVKLRVLKDTTILTILINKWTNDVVAKGVTSEPYKENLLKVQSERNFGDFVNRMKKSICNDVNECSGGSCRRGVCRDIINDFECVCPEQYADKDCSRDCRMPSDVVFALDSSGNLKDSEFMQVTDFVKMVITKLDVTGGTRVGLETISDQYELRYHLNTYIKSKPKIYNATNFKLSGGKTNTGSAIKYMYETMFKSNRGARDNLPHTAVLFQDRDSTNDQETMDQALRAKKAGVQFLVVALGKQYDTSKKEIEIIASDPNAKNIFWTERYDQLNRDLANKLASAICNNENECEPNPCENGGTCRDYINYFECECPRERTGSLCQLENSGQIEVVFAVDYSGSINQKFKARIQPLVLRVIEQLEISREKTRVGLVSWSDKAKQHLKLSDYQTKRQVMHAVQIIKYEGGKTATYQALRMLRNSAFTGSRSGVRKFVVLISDGASNVDPDRTHPEAKLLRLEGASVIAVSTDRNSNQAEMRGIASYPEEKNMIMVTGDNINEPANKVIAAIYGRNLCRNNPCSNGGQCTNGVSTYYCRCPGDRAGQRCQQSCQEKLDIAIVLDRSGSTDIQFERQVTFAKELVNILNVGDNRARIGVVVYDTNAAIDIRLDKYKEKKLVIDALTYTSNNGGKTNAADAIRKSRDLLSRDRGGRKYAIFITDGKYNREADKVEEEAKRAKANNIVILSAGLDNNSNRPGLLKIANGEQGHVFVSENPKDLASRVLRRVCQR